MSRRANRYAELSGRIVSAARFCEFLDAGGRVLTEEDSSGWRDVTADVLHKERHNLHQLERIRALLYADMVANSDLGAGDDRPASTMH